MDYVLKKLNSHVEVSMGKTVERQTLLRERIEYMLFQALGCLWNNIQEVTPEKRKKIVADLNKMSIGEVVGAIRDLDVHNLVFKTKKQLNILDKYPKLRNQALGHGYTHADSEGYVEEELEALYQEFMQIDFFKHEFDVVCVKNEEGGKYHGIRLSVADGGMPNKWSCPKEYMGEDIPENTVFLLSQSMEYYCISPFVYIDKMGEAVYVFQSLEDKLSGSVKFNQLFQSGNINISVKELIYVAQDSERRRISANYTIMNYYEQNYDNYIKVPLEKKVKDFLKENRSNIQATIWGHGGVGKTACVQNICMELFNDVHQVFSYIVFVSAKDRKYEKTTGKIINIDNIRTYQEILDNIIAVVYDENDEEEISEKEEKILSTTNKVLLVIDDYETFQDKEKEKIQNFIEKLNLDYFKVLITTRNKRFSTGVEIKLDELNMEDTKIFLEQVFENEYPGYLEKITKVLTIKDNLNKIHQATSGRALFLYQFANLFVQKGLNDNIIEELKNSENAKEFLYGRMYECLGKIAQKQFKVISQIIDEKDLIFKEEILLYLLNDSEKEYYEEGIQELLDQKIIERFDEDNFRLYSQDLLGRMTKSFNDSDEAFKDRIKNKIRDIGGKRIKGTVYEAMLEEANLSRNKGNVQDTLQRYKHILNDKQADRRIKRKALLNLTSYISINLMDNEQTISIFEEYIDKLAFGDDVDVIKMYVGYLWRSDDIAKTKACDILERFFKKPYHKKTDSRNLELYAMAVNYCSHNVIDNTPEKVKKSAEIRIINEYGKHLYRRVSTRPLNEHKPAIRHSISLALIATVKVAMDLTQRGYNNEQLICDIKAYGMKNFSEYFKKQLNGLNVKGENRKIEGDIVDARITYIATYGILVDIADMGKAIIHNTEMKRGQRDKLEKGVTIKAKIIGHNEKGYILSTKELYDSDNPVGANSHYTEEVKGWQKRLLK